MIGYQDPTLGTNRRKALAQYLKSQSAQRAQNAQQMRGFNLSALGSRAPSAGTPFLRGGSKAAPEKFAFAGMKPNLKTLLGLVGQNMGNGGAIDTRFFSPDLPVGGLSWGGYIPDTPTGMPSAAPMGTPFAAPTIPQYFNPSIPVGQPGGQTVGDAVEGNVENIWGFPTNSGQKAPPILGDLLYGDMFGGFR